MDRENDVYEIDLLKLLKALWEHILFIIGATIIGLLIGVVIAKFFVTATYQSEAMFYVNNKQNVNSSSVSSSDVSASKSLVSTYSVILQSRDILEAIIKKADVDYTTKELKAMISANSVNSTECIKITVTTPDKNDSKKIADAIVTIFPEQIVPVVEGSSAKVFEYPSIAQNKNYPSVTKFGLIGAFLACCLVCFIICLLELFNNTIDDSKDLAEFDLPILAVIPDLDLKDTGSYYSYQQTNKEEE